MKEIASLWISGITTVAMLAVAVGSFAAWDTLTGKSDNLQVQTSTPVVLSVDSKTDGTETGTFKLVPKDAVTDSTSEKTEVKVGEMTVVLKGTTDAKKISSINLVSGVYDTAERTGTANEEFKVILKKNGGSDEVTQITPDELKTAADTGIKYDVYMAFAKDNADATAVDTPTDKYAKIEITAVK